MPEKPKVEQASKPGHFQICAEMAKRGMDIRMSLLENITNVRYEKRTKGTAVTIGIDGNLVGQIALENKFVGGLLLCDKEQYFALAKELASHAPTPAPEPTHPEPMDALALYYEQKDGCKRGHPSGCGKICLECVEEELKIARRASTPAAAQGAPDGKVSTPGGAEGSKDGK